ncbi:MAG: Fe-S cluster assembly protein SufD [Verrucomicrobia bacterium]|nr:MAG: Fe-S cluster assembly protein SufD [Verrucomicrobiota bacterium]TAE88388.1 MAG: Fe-S cluster assembly protein SufD [Verrucomicrobiota bacterium]TAF26842.1 MAG: Fe-S cluster assembly protein SufD [Verrucomicrobiota bacterium]TAF42100.1 MAG: Fe-S cluster assembly protein SufD [Verrucomicrobiota bacterium]
MSVVLEHSSSLLDSAPETPAAFPAWFADRQRAAWQRFLDTPTPKRGDEMWRFSTLKQLDFSVFTKGGAGDSSVAIVQRSTALESPVAKFVFVNDRLLHAESKLPQGVLCLPLAEALVTHGDLVREHFMKQDSRLGSAKWTALHEANLSNGLFVHVPANVEVVGSIEVFHWLGGENATIFPHTLVVTGANAKVRVVDYFQSVNDDEAGLCVAVNDLIAGPGSKLDYLAIQAFNERTRVIQVNETGVARDASATGFILNIGAAWARNESLSRLDGEGSRSDMLSVSVPARAQEYDQRTFQHHVSPGAYSDLLYKNSLYDKSRTIFSGLIFVDEGAHRTDAYQTCRNLFMSEDAEANSMPGLEINADDVKCSHGSTSAAISDEEIFYLRARGIDPVRARQLIARGFSVEVIERLGDEKVEEMVLRFLDDKFARIASGGA